MDINFNTMTLSELRSLQTKINRAISTFDERRKKEALIELEDKARQMGFSLSQLIGGTSPRLKTSSPAAYQNPENAEETWSGRGRKPHWFINALAMGFTPDDLRIS